jgi:hypothetical protein
MLLFVPTGKGRTVSHCCILWQQGPWIMTLGSTQAGASFWADRQWDKARSGDIQPQADSGLCAHKALERNPWGLVKECSVLMVECTTGSVISGHGDQGHCTHLVSGVNLTSSASGKPVCCKTLPGSVSVMCKMRGEFKAEDRQTHTHTHTHTSIYTFILYMCSLSVISSWIPYLISQRYTIFSWAGRVHTAHILVAFHGPRCPS